LYVQWTVITIAAAFVAVAAARYHERHLTTVTPEAVLAGAAGTGVVRVQGQVAAGSLEGDPTPGRASFRLSGENAGLPVQYEGPPPENLRELKTLVVVGRWEPDAGVFRGHDVALVTNYGFVVGAYLAGFLPIAALLFAMERRVRALYAEIKRAKLYEPEPIAHVDPR
jgi:cytochrome c-type biogenesis protein CcmE